MTLAAGLAGARSWAVRSRAGWIWRPPDRYPLVRLRQEPTGEPVVVRADGTRIRAISAGASLPVVLAHGYGVSLLVWNVVAEALVDAGYQVIAFDQRGHGQSILGGDGVGSAPMAEDCLAVLDHFGVYDGVLVGHSMGGFLALRLLLDHPEVTSRLRRPVLGAAFAGRIWQGAPQHRLQLPLLRWGILPRVGTTRIGGLLGAFIVGDAPSPAEITVLLEVFLRQDHRVVLGILHACAGEDTCPRLGELRVPTVVICGSNDKVTSPRHSQRLAAAIPNAQMVSVPGGGHLLYWEAPDTLIQAVQAFPPLPPPAPGSARRVGSEPPRAPG